MANLGLGSSMAPPASTPTPGAIGVMRAAAHSHAGGVAGLSGPALPDFAADLARLAALLGGARPGPATPIVATDATTDTSALPVLAEETDVAVEALCAEVALGVPAPSPPCPVPTTPDAAPSGDPVAAEPELPDVAAQGPARTLQVLLTPPGRTVAGEHRSAPAPEMPTLPLLPAAAAGAAAFTVTTDAASDTSAAGTLPIDTAADVTPAPPSAVPVAVNIAERPVAAPHVVAATVIDALQPQAPRQLAETVAWHVPAQGAAEVQIRLNPDELGPLEIKLKLDGDKVSVRFDLADERVRDVVQSSLPSLSAMLSARGLQLDQAQVFAQSRAGQGSSQHPSSSQSSWSSVRKDGDDAGSELSVSSVARPLIRRGLLDDYA